MGNAFTLVRLIVAFISVICGLLVDLLCRPTSKSQGILVHKSPHSASARASIGLGTNTPLSPARPTQGRQQAQPWPSHTLWTHYTARRLGRLDIGLLLGGLLPHLLPENWMSGWSMASPFYSPPSSACHFMYVRPPRSPWPTHDCCRALPGLPDLTYLGPQPIRDGRGRVANAWTFGNTDVSA